MQSTPPDCSIRGTDYSMFHVLEVMVNRSWRSLAVINNFKGVNCVVTQSALIKYLLKALDGSKLLKTSAGKFRPFASVVKVLGSTSVFDAVRLMNREGVRAVAIVDEKDVLQDNFSLHDLTALGDNGQRANMLSLSVQAFKDWVKTHDVWSPMSSVVVKGTTTLGKVMREMVDNDIHRVYVVNSKAERVVLDVIAMTDVLRFILRQCTYPLV